MENEKKNKYAKEMEVIFNSVSSEVTDNEIKKITFETSKGNITWKPKTAEERMINGMLVKEKFPMKLDKMPKELIEFNQKISNSGSLKTIIEYGIMEAEQDGEMKTYRFITSIEQFKRWKVIEDKPEQVTIK